MILIIGLGNPGEKYQLTRHNIGRLIVSSWQLVAWFPNFKFNKKFNALISKGIFNKKKIVLALPETFMNLSGKSVKSLTTNYKLPTTNLWVIHDDIDLPLGKIRIVKNRGSAGHKGVESIIRELKTKEFIRFRIGISQFAQNQKSNEFVLKNFTKNEEKIVKKLIKKIAEAIEFSLKEGIEKAMSRFNK